MTNAVQYKPIVAMIRIILDDLKRQDLSALEAHVTHGGKEYTISITTKN